MSHIPTSLGNLIEFFSDDLPAWLKKREHYKSTIEFYKAIPFSYATHRKNGAYVFLEIHLKTDRIDSGVCYKANQKNEFLSNIRQIMKRIPSEAQPSWEKPIALARAWAKSGKTLIGKVERLWVCFDVQSMKNKNGPVVFYFDLPPVPIQFSRKTIFGPSTRKTCKIMLGQDFDRARMDPLNTLLKKIKPGQILRNLGVNSRDESSRLKIYISGTLDDSLAMCARFKKGPEQAKFLKSVTTLKKFYSDHPIAMEIDVDNGVLIKSNFEIFFDRDETKKNRFISKLMNWPFFTDFVVKEQREDIQKIFSRGPVEKCPFDKTEIYMKPSHLKLAHDANGLPQWKLYLGFVIRDSIRK